MIRKINNSISKGFDFDDGDLDDEDVDIIDCKYYTIEELNAKRYNSLKNFSILHLNIHSLEFHLDELRIALQLIDLKFDFICLTESKIRKNYEPKIDIKINGYQFPVGTPTEAGKGGVLIYVKDGIDFMPREDLNIYKSKGLESHFIEAINKKGKNTIIGSIYRHPCMDENTFLDDYMQPLLDKLSIDNKKAFIAGDFNFNLLNTDHTETSNFFESMMSNHLLPTITIPTKINPKKSTIIDNIFTNQIHPDMCSGNFKLAISDHLPSFFLIPRDNQNHQPKQQNLFTRKTKNFDKTNFIIDYLDIDWETTLNVHNNDVNLSLQAFLTKINELLDVYMPLRKVTKNEYKRRFKPWIKDNILHKIKEKDKAFRKYMKCKDEMRKNTLKTEFNTLKNEVLSLTRQSKKEFYNKYFIENSKNLRKIWQGINEIINIKNKNFCTPTCIIENEKTITDPKEISNSFNRYYASVAEDILKERKYEGSKLYSDYLKNPAENSFAIYECSSTEVENIINSLKPNKSSGPNSIPCDILYMLKKDISKPLFIIYNISLTTGIYPDLLKISKTIPIYKKGSKLLTCNYRPISLLSNLNKILEKLMFNRVYNYLEDNNHIYSFQFGFRKKHSTNHTLIEITESIRNALDNNNFACGVFIDLQKAFDTVNHSILINKLEYYGIRGIENTWFKSYLSNRKQFVSTLGYNSNICDIKHGVPQGSVLGPLLFLLYINDLHSAIKHSSIYHFADDTNLLNINMSPKKLQKQVNTDLKYLYQWLLANKISLNCSKTELIFFTKPGHNIQDFKFKIKINGHKITPANHIKYLGIHLDTSLSGKYHCETVINKLKRANSMLSKIRHYVPKEELKSIYHAIFSSHMIYGCQVWGQCCNTYVDKIYKLQNKALRIINFTDFHSNVNPLYFKDNIIKLRDFIKLQNCLFVHDYLNDSLPQCFKDYYFKLNYIYFNVQTRSSNLGCLFATCKNTTTYGLNSITHKSIRTWNAISNEMKTDLSVLPRYKVKSLLTKYFIDKYQ